MDFESPAVFKSISFAEIAAVWAAHLWPNRQSPIEPISWIDIHGGIDPSILDFARPRFVGLVENRKLVAVTSYFQTGIQQWRLRGNWTSAERRSQGLGQRLVQIVFNEVFLVDPEAQIWTMARHSAISFYKKLGFTEGKKVFGYEFGPHQILSRANSKL